MRERIATIRLKEGEHQELLDIDRLISPNGSVWLSIESREKTLKPIGVFLGETYTDYIGSDKDSTHSIDLMVSYFDRDDKFKEDILRSTTVNRETE